MLVVRLNIGGKYMCQNNCNTENKKNKVLSQIELGKIESKLDEGYNSTQIAEYIGRDSSCIQKEIKNFSVIKISKKNCGVKIDFGHKSVEMI